MREWGVEAVTYLVKAALQHKYQPPLRDNQVSYCQIYCYSLYSKLQCVLKVLDPIKLAVFKNEIDYCLWFLAFGAPCIHMSSFRDIPYQIKEN
jgi:hypothetical protein